MPILKNPRHERFAQARAKGNSADAAYVLAGFKAHRGNASRLSANESIRARTREILNRGAKEAETTVASITRELARMGFSDIRQALDEEGNLLSPELWPDTFAASVSSIEVITRPADLVSEDDEEVEEELEPQGHGGALKRQRKPAKVELVHKIKFWDKNSALEKLAKYLGMFSDRPPAPPPGPPVEHLHSGSVVHKHELSDDSIKKIAALVK